MLGKDAAVCEQDVTRFGCMEGPLLFIEVPCKIYDQEHALKCVIALLPKHKTIMLFCILVPQSAPEASYRPNTFSGSIRSSGWQPFS